MQMSVNLHGFLRAIRRWLMTGKDGRQSIIVNTKNGNYLYIIIDRDDDGDETVQFLI